MQRFWFLTLAGCCTLALTVLLGGSQPPTEVKKHAKASAKKAAPKLDPDDEEFLRRADVKPEADALLRFLKKRTLPEADRPAIEELMRRLRSNDYRIREKAYADLVKRGAAALELLQASVATSLEVRRRIAGAIARIRARDGPPEARAAAVRVLAQLKPAGLAGVLLGYAPFADNPSVRDEVRRALLQCGMRGGKADPHLVAALGDRSAVRRALAGETLARLASAGHKDALHKLLHDADATVRYRTARGLAFAKDKTAVPTLIDALAELPINDAWRDEDFLLRLAGPITPPDEPMGNAKEAREKCKAGWHSWWRINASRVDLAKLTDDPKTLGRTLIVLLDEKMVLELGPDNRPRWEIRNVNYPLDAQLIGDDQVLLAEYYGHRVTVRDTRGDIRWGQTVQGPQVAQRLANGNTFVVTGSEFIEYDKTGKLVDAVSVSDDERRLVMKAMKLDNGEIVAMTADARIVRYSAAGKELSSFPIAMGMRLYGGRIDALPHGRVLVPHNAENKVVEYDRKGKAIWEVPFQQPIAVTRAPNGNTLITSMDPAVGAIEVDRTGAEVWSYRSASRVTRAIRR